MGQCVWCASIWVTCQAVTARYAHLSCLPVSCPLCPLTGLSTPGARMEADYCTMKSRGKHAYTARVAAQARN